MNQYMPSALLEPVKRTPIAVKKLAFCIRSGIICVIAIRSRQLPRGNRDRFFGEVRVRPSEDTRKIEKGLETSSGLVNLE